MDELANPNAANAEATTELPTLPADGGTGADLTGLAGEMAPGEMAPTDMLHQALEMLQAGGPIVAILIAMSVIALSIALAKMWQFAAMRVGDTKASDRALRLWRAGRGDEALAVAKASPSPSAQVVAIALRGMRRGMPEDRIREEAMRHGEVIMESLRSWMRPLEVTASLAPLLGLLGTVQGMITAFQQMEAAGNAVNPSVLSGGIWEALLTTAVGLAVAIPTVTILNILERRTERAAHRMDIALSRAFSDELTDTQADEVTYAGHGFRAAVAPGE